MVSAKKGAFVEVAVPQASSLDLSPRVLISLALLHMLWGGLGLPVHADDAVFDLVVGGFYLLNGLLLYRLVQSAAMAALMLLGILTPVYGFMFVANLWFSGGIKHAKPMVLFVLGVLSIIDIVRRLRNWDALKAKRRTELTYRGSLNIRSLTWRVLDLASIGAAIGAILLFVYLTNGGKQTNLSFTIVFFFVMAGLAGVANLSNYRSRQYRALKATTVFHKDERKPVLLLRSFAEDMIGIKRSGRLPLPFYLGDMRGPTFEETITSHLARYGPVLAIGRPGESLPPLGAAREYVSNEDWQRRVSSLVDESAAIIVLLGTTRGLGWELREIYERNAQSKTVLVLPPPKPGNQPGPEQRWKAFYEVAMEAGGWNLPEKMDLDRTLLIDLENGLLYVADSHDAERYTAAFEKAMKVFFEQEIDGE